MPVASSWASKAEYGSKFKDFAASRPLTAANPDGKNLLYKNINGSPRHPSYVTQSLIAMLSSLLAQDPEKRTTAHDALEANYFFESPVVKMTSEMRKIMNFRVESVHEMGARNFREMKDGGDK